MAERSGVIEKQARDGARRSEAKSSVGEEIESPVGTQGIIMENGGQTGFTIEKGFRGQHFEHISNFEGEREISSGIPAHFPDLERIRADKGILFRNREWEWWQSV